MDPNIHIGVGLETSPFYECDSADGKNRVRFESDDVRTAVVDHSFVLYDDLEDKYGRGVQDSKDEGMRSFWLRCMYL